MWAEILTGFLSLSQENCCPKDEGKITKPTQNWISFCFPPLKTERKWVLGKYIKQFPRDKPDIFIFKLPS